jgi:D-glycero-D-manno-heptose 1,7-bisphosphate phosphatase
MMDRPLEMLAGDLARNTASSKKPLRPAVFIDRDGTLNAEAGYLCDPDKVVLLPTAGEALRLLNRRAIPVVIVTNQSALGRGLLTFEQLEAVNTALWQALEQAQAYYDALYFCPHTPDQNPPCACRKPQPGLLFQAAFELGLDLSRSFMLGDKLSDLQAGRAAGCQASLVRTGWWRQTYQEMASQAYEPDYIASTLLEAAEWINNELRK